MCTVTLHRSAHGTIVTMNRDELRVRPEGVIRQTKTQHGVGYLFPVDAFSGGTWLGINACGVGACLLNRYGETHLQDNSDIISRGTIIPQILESRNLKQAYQLIEQLPLHRFRNFDLLLFNDNIVLHYTHENGLGSAQHRTDNWLMLTSSSWNKDAVLGYRQYKFNEYDPERSCYPDIAESILRDFHLLADEDRRFSVLMSRAESHTKSVSQIILDRNSASLRYIDEINLHRLATALNAGANDFLGNTISMTRQI